MPPRVIKEYNRLPKDVKGQVKQLNNLTGAEWTSLSKSVISYGGQIAKKRREHGAAFPVELASHYIKLLTLPGDTVLDPFLGVGTVTDACTLLGRHSIGFEINPRFFELASHGLDPVDGEPALTMPVCRKIFNESCLRLTDHIEDNSIDLTLTSPPYAHLLRQVAAHFGGYQYEKNIYKNEGRRLPGPYTDDENDFGNLDWTTYQLQVHDLMTKLYQVSRPGAYNVWVVKDFRDIQAHVPYVNLHSKIIDAAIAAQWVHTDIAIWNQSDQRKLVKLGGPKARRFYFNIGHSYILVFRKNLPGEKFQNI